MVWIVSVVVMVLLLDGCSKTETAKQTTSGTRPVVAPSTPAADAPSSNPRKIVDYMAGMKDLKDYNKPVDKSELAKEAATAVQAASAAKKAAETKQASAPAPKAAEPTAAPAPVQPPPTKAPGDNVVAKAAPSAAPSVVTTATPVSREAPEFPREAVKASVDSGTVRARMTIDAAGNVTNVLIVEARPARVFDRAVRDTLGRWKFNSGAEGRSYETEVEFRR